MDGDLWGLDKGDKGTALKKIRNFDAISLRYKFYLLFKECLVPLSLQKTRPDPQSFNLFGFHASNLFFVFFNFKNLINFVDKYLVK